MVPTDRVPDPKNAEYSPQDVRSTFRYNIHTTRCTFHMDIPPLDCTTHETIFCADAAWLQMRVLFGKRTIDMI